MSAEDREDKEVTFTFSSEAAAAAGGEETERKETPEEFLARQQREAEEAEGEEDRGDHFEPDEEVQPAEIPGNLEDIQKLLEEGAEQPAKPAAAQIMIPKTRFDEVNGKMKDAVARAEAAEKQLAELAGKPAAPAVEFDFDEAELRYIHALTEEGDQTKALEIRKEIRAAEQATFKAQASGSVSEVNAQATAQGAFLDVVASAIDLYPFLDSTKPDTMNSDAIDMVVALRNKYEGEGKSSAAALELAVSKVGPMFSKTEPAEPAPKEKTQAELRAEEALRRNATAAKQQPANIGRLGEQAGKTTRTVAEMSEKEFDALPDEEKRRLRGDEV